MRRWNGREKEGRRNNTEGDVKEKKVYRERGQREGMKWNEE